MAATNYEETVTKRTLHGNCSNTGKPRYRNYGWLQSRSFELVTAADPTDHYVPDVYHI